MAVYSDCGDGLKVEVADFVLATSGKKDGGRSTPWSSWQRWRARERGQMAGVLCGGGGVHVVRTGGKGVAGRVQTSAW